MANSPIFFFFFFFNSVELSSRDTENLNTEKDYYNDLPGKLPPELLDPVEEISSQHAQSLRKLTIQVWSTIFSLALTYFNHILINNYTFSIGKQNSQKPRERLSSNLIDLNSPPPDPNYVNDKSFDVNSNTTPPAITRDVFDMRMFPCIIFWFQVSIILICLFVFISFLIKLVLREILINFLLIPFFFNFFLKKIRTNQKIIIIICM